MKKNGFTTKGLYKRVFLSERTALVSAMFIILILPVTFFLGSRSGELNMSDQFDMLMRLALVITLFSSMKKHKLLLMQAATVGLLFCMLCSQSQYAFANLLERDSEIYINMGLQGFIFLAVENMILFIESFVCVSHFIIFAAKRQEAIRISVNQTAVIFLFLLLIIQLIISPFLSFPLVYVLFIWTYHLDEFFTFILVACAELILMIDQREITGE